MLSKFADLPHEVEAEIRGLDEARRRIAELERQIRKLKSSSAARQIDEGAIDHAVRVAVERERTTWRRKLEQGRVGFRQMIGRVASAGQALETLKVMLEQAASESAISPGVFGAPDSSLNHRPARDVKPMVQRAASAQVLDERVKLASGERRILTVLAQHSEGRSKVQVAILSGYAPNGGGFNNYLGALRTRGLIEGSGERLAITEAGTEALGSWEPLPRGSALIDYWRARLGKAERLILEVLTECYPEALIKEEVAAKAGYEANGGGFNNALGRLRTLELVQGRGEIRASDNLFASG